MYKRQTLGLALAVTLPLILVLALPLTLALTLPSVDKPADLVVEVGVLRSSVSSLSGSSGSELLTKLGMESLSLSDIARASCLWCCVVNARASSSLPSAKKLVKSYESHNGTTCCPSVRSAATHDARRRSP